MQLFLEKESFKVSQIRFCKICHDILEARKIGLKTTQKIVCQKVKPDPNVLKVGLTVSLSRPESFSSLSWFWNNFSKGLGRLAASFFFSLKIVLTTTSGKRTVSLVKKPKVLSHLHHHMDTVYYQLPPYKGQGLLLVSLAKWHLVL